MIAVVKQYAVALLILLAVILLMVLGTWGVKSFGDKMFEDSGVKMQPRGERINK
ncbi:MAG: hypothetical protein PF439_10130 [Helicobacteraceae bacterium]|jgi:flagellar biogenesis protein FliO|nr:hypothetical protein [Helicobacteraceae bacterium]